MSLCRIEGQDMAHGYSTRRLAIGVVILLLLCGSVPFLAARLRAKGPSFRTVPTTGWNREFDEEADFYEFVNSLPSFQTLQATLDELANVSRKLLRTASSENEESLPLIAADYRKLIHRARDEFAVLASRIGEDRAVNVLNEDWLSRSESFDGLPTELLSDPDRRNRNPHQ